MYHKQQYNPHLAHIVSHLHENALRPSSIISTKYYHTPNISNHEDYIVDTYLNYPYIKITICFHTRLYYLKLRLHNWNLYIRTYFRVIPR